MDIFGSLSSLERVLDYHLKRHNVLSSNLSNAETPGYRPKDLRFSQTMSDAQHLVRTDPSHADPSMTGSIVEVEEAPISGMDENGVSLELAMAKLAANRIRYEAGIELANRRLALLRYAATSGQ